ncbi:MAG: CRTAC1 family protein, partial [Phycisphaerae bacterium]|nr:CRTAC1 family protein [Phycisphaerae bacterium]
VDVAGLAAGDVDGDGDLDVCIAGMGKDGLTGLWINDGKGNFAAGATLEGRNTGPCFGDVDNDGDLDLWLGGIGGEGFFENDGKGKLSQVTGEWAGGETITSAPLLADIDSDGDLDLLAMRMKEGSVPAGAKAEPIASRVWINNRDGTYAELAAKLGLSLESKVVTAMAFDDFDNDRDLDLVLFFFDGEAMAWVNDRGWAFHTLGREATGIAARQVVGVATGDPDKDGDRDLLMFGEKEVALYLNQGGFKFVREEDFSRKFGLLGGTGGQFADMDNDGDLDIVIGDAHWKDNKRGPALLSNNWPEKGFTDVVAGDAGNLLGAIRFPGAAACTAADFTGDGKCDILLAPTGEPPMLLINQTAGGHWLAIDLMGMREQDKKSRSNHSAIGARVEVKTGAVYQQFTVGGATGAATTGPLRIHAGLGSNTKVDWLRIIWPDGVLQAELEVPGNQVLPLRELQRKTSSCPHLFAWDGIRYAFVGDFGGMGGLGYLAEPGVYARPDSTEYLRIPKLAEREGYYILQILEPLEEAVYVDEIQLLAVDHPEGTEVYPNEMMAISVDPPAFELFCYREPVRPKRVMDHRGVDVTSELMAEDRDCAGATKIDPRFVGYAEKHFVDLDFGDEIDKLTHRRTVLFLQGWLEYPYSATAFAAWQAKTPLRAPTIEVWRDGQWVT